ncbi:hypothetical protein ACXX9E_29735 [Pseudomonas sp. GNP014]
MPSRHERVLLRKRMQAALSRQKQGEVRLIPRNWRCRLLLRGCCALDRRDGRAGEAVALVHDVAESPNPQTPRTSRAGAPAPCAEPIPVGREQLLHSKMR